MDVDEDTESGALRIAMEDISMENDKVPFARWLDEIHSAESEFRRLSLFLKLPSMCDITTLTKENMADVVQLLPINLISQFMLQQHDEDVVSFVVDILLVLLPYCSDEEIPSLSPLLEGIREDVCSNQFLTKETLEYRVKIMNRIGVKFFSVDDLNSLLNAILSFLKEDVSALPSEEILVFVRSCLFSLTRVFEEGKEMNVVALSWPADLKVLVERLLRTKNIGEQFHYFSFVVSSLAVQIVGIKWILFEPQVLLLLASLTSGYLRIITEQPNKICSEVLISCLTLEETFTKCIESEEDLIPDITAEPLSKSVQEAASFSCEYLSACDREKVTLSNTHQFAFYRFIAMFGAVGGFSIINKDHLNGAIPNLLRVCDLAIAQRDAETAGLLLLSLQDLPSLPSTTLDVIMNYVQLLFPSDRCKCLSQLCAMLEQLNGKTDFYNAASLKKALDFARNVNDQHLLGLLSSLPPNLPLFPVKQSPKMGLVLFGVLALVAVVSIKYIKWLIDVVQERIRAPLGSSDGTSKVRSVVCSSDVSELTGQMLEWKIYYTEVLQSDLIRFWLGPFPLVAMLSPDATRVVLESMEYLTKGDEYEIMKRWIGTGLLTSQGDKWKSRRKMITPAFHFAMLNEYHRVHDAEAQVLTEQFAPFAESGKPFDAFPFIKRCALDIICETAMGTKVNAQTDHSHPYVAAVKRMNELSFTYSRMPWLWIKPIWYLLGYGDEYDGHLKEVTDFTRKVIAERRQNFSGGSGEPSSKKKAAFLDLLLQVQNEGDLTDEDIREEVDTFMFEGHDTTSSGMAWTIWCLAHNPQCQKLVHEELDRVFGQPPHRACTLEDLKQLTYLDQCIKESLRIFPPVPFFTRKLGADLQCLGYTIPKNTTLLLNPGVLHTNPRLYPDPWTYNPANFEPERMAKRHPFAFIPFSAGPRNCVGQKFALMEEKTVLSWVFRKFQVNPTADFKANRACPEITLKPSLGIPITVTRRYK